MSKYLGSIGEDAIFFPTRWSLLARSRSFGNNDHPNIFCLPNDPQNKVSSEQATPRATVAAAEEDLRNLITARKVYDCLRSIVTFQDSRFDMEISRKAQVLFDSISILLWQATVVPKRYYKNCEAISTEIVGHSAAAPDKHSC